MSERPDRSRMAGRASWPVRRFRLGEEPGDDLSASTSPAERVEMVWTLTLEAWSVTGRPLPDYPRHEAPVRILLAALLQGEARFLVVGAHAMALHGVPRATGDLDVWIQPTVANAALVWEGLQRFGAPLGAPGVAEADLHTAGIVVQIGTPPRRIDLLTDVTGLTFEEAWARRVVQQIGGMSIPFLGRDDLIRNKRATARPKDLADLAALDSRDSLDGE